MSPVLGHKRMPETQDSTGSPKNRWRRVKPRHEKSARLSSGALSIATEFEALLLSAQPIFAVPMYFSVLVGNPPPWVSAIVALFPLGLRFRRERLVFRRTQFDLPILLFVLGTLVGFAVAPDKGTALGALLSTFASVLIYYGITSNSEAPDRYWLRVGVTVCILTLLASIWFFSQGNGRDFFFNDWAFKLFGGLPRTGVSLQLHSLGALLAVVIPPLILLSLFGGLLRVRVAALALGILFLGILVLDASGTGWVAVLSGVVFVILCWRISAISIIAPTVGVAAAGFLALYNRVRWLSASFSIDSLLDRADLWAKTFSLMKDWHAVVGLGLGTWFYTFQSHFQREVEHSHNSYIQIYADTGILGVLAIIIAYVLFVRLSMKALALHKRGVWRGIAVGITGSIVAGGVFALLDVTTYGVVETASGIIYLSIPLLWIFVALFVVAYTRATKKGVSAVAVSAENARPGRSSTASGRQRSRKKQRGKIEEG